MSDAAVTAAPISYPAPPHSPMGASPAARARPGKVWLAALALLLVVTGVLAPLADIDLPIHLALGEWIVRHRAVPWTEPFAWTRAGAPYFDYSWGADAAYYLAWRAFGPLALHVLAGIQLFAAAAAAGWMGHEARWRPWTVFLAVWGQVWVATAMSDYLRPQTLLLAIVPAAWALTLRIRRGAAPRRAASGLYVVAMIAANTHSFFFLTALPLVGFVVPGPPESRAWPRVTLCVLALVLGWLSTPYGIAWPAIVQLNAAHNAVLSFPSPIVELMPGFLGVSLFDRARLAGMALTLLPWGLAGERMPQRERAVYAALWLAGLVAFALAVRALLVWWLMMLPLIGVLGDRATRRLTPLVARTILAAACAWIAVLSVRYAIAAHNAWPPEAGPAATAKTLPSPAAALIEPELAWLDKNAAHPIRGRLLTVLSFGSYVAWRMPGLSESVDGRTIFPDSAAGPDAYRRSAAGAGALGPWKSADVAIVPLTFPVASVLDTARGWRRVGIENVARERSPWTPGLWVRTAWFQGAGGH